MRRTLSVATPADPCGEKQILEILGCEECLEVPVTRRGILKQQGRGLIFFGDEKGRFSDHLLRFSYHFSY